MAERVTVPLLGALADLVKWLESEQISAMVVGGVASSLLGRPRLTQDLDALAILPENEWEAAMQAAHKFGIVPRIGQAIDFARLVAQTRPIGDRDRRDSRRIAF